MTRALWILLLGAASFLAIGASRPATAQQRATGAPFQEPSAQSTPPPAASVSAPAKKKKHSYADDYLVRGTVFTAEGLSFPGAELRVRRSDQKKFHWETYTNSRGEFALRVPQGASYEVVVRAKGFAEQSHALDAKGGREENLVFRMEAVKPGERK